PSIFEAGIAGLWTPILIPRIGECVKNCNLCSKVCPTQAIMPIELNEKHYIFIGRAVIDRSHCIAWNSDKVCLVCDEFCSYNAIFWEKINGVKRPFIDEHRCVGCGICEKACPIQPLAAIRVFSFGDKRNQTRDQQKRFYENSPLHQREGFKF
ncbi:MAG: 4Fe-4S dicluster domain-containing protein, partial [Armatimonadota bacterium]